MATFENTRDQYKQIHFEVLEIDLPVISGACTVGGVSGLGTPLTCDQSWAGEYKTYYFTNTNAPLLPISAYRVITSISEAPTELKPGQGLASRGSWRVTLNDFIGDPNEGAPGVTTDVISQGTFFGKLKQRQIIDNKPARLKLYRVEEDGTIDITNGAQEKNIVLTSLDKNSNNTYTMSFKDVLFAANEKDKTWPVSTGGYLRLDISDTETTIPVDQFTDYSSAEVVRISSEFMRVTSVANNLTATAELTVQTRGIPIDAAVSGARLTRTIKEEHSAGDEVFICDVSDNETIDGLLSRILIDSGIDATRIPSAEWAAEITEWHPSDLINTIHYEAEDVNSVLKRILNGYLLDMWADPVSFEIKLSAISVWKQSTAVLTEGREIDSYQLTEKVNDSLRASRALVLYGKSILSESDDVGSYAKGSIFADNTIIGEQFYKEHKDKRFDSNFIIDKDAADLLVQRYVSRFKLSPREFSFTTQERFLTFNTGDVVDLQSYGIQTADGSLSTDRRAQILSIATKFTKEGRKYSVKALTYESALLSGSEIVISSPLGNTNLFIQAGSPSQPVTITFILDGTYSYGSTSFFAGGFASGSKLIIILANGFDGQANGGKGGDGESIEWDTELNQLLTVSESTQGGDGGIVYDAQGVDTDIYFSGATPSTAYPVADGYIRAPSGGAGGFNHTGAYPAFVSGNSGGGGDGRNAGVAGLVGYTIGANSTQGTSGVNGEIDGTGTGWGVDGATNAKSGGLKGKGVVDSGATVTFFGDTPTRYINGAGDHP